MRFFYRSFFILLFLFATPFYTIFGRTLVTGGESVGIELMLEGVLVSGTYDVKQGQSVYNPKTHSDIQIGDMILAINKSDISSINDLVTYLKNLDGSEQTVSLTIKRGEKVIFRNLKLVKSNAGGWKTGLLVKEKVLGIGTITYYDAENKTYGALGHEITGVDGKIIDVESGTIYESNVVGVKKSENGEPGEKIAKIEQENTLGNVQVNNRYGIYGEIVVIPEGGITLEVREKEDVKIGPAEVWTVVNGKQVERFTIEITAVRSQDIQNIKGITFRITDKALLDKTNGIVQGMSGSPIIQDGEIVGAVTHVLVDQVNMGHGIFIEWMLKESDKIK